MLMMKVKPLPSDPFKFYQEVERIGSHIPANFPIKLHLKCEPGFAVLERDQFDLKHCAVIFKQNMKHDWGRK